MSMSEKLDLSNSDGYDIDDEAFARGREFLDGLRQGLRSFSGYPGTADPGHKYPHVNQLTAEIKPNPRERLFFKINGGLTSVDKEEFSLDGNKRTRMMPQIHSGIPVTEARKALVKYRPDSSSGYEQAFVYGLFETMAEPQKFGVIAVRSIYAVRDLRRLELAVVRKDEISSLG
jgi:hypothetical protein